jgi:hypothetical protein
LPHSWNNGMVEYWNVYYQRKLHIYLVLKSLVLWARSEVFGYASQSFNRNNGTMDEWNGGLRNTVLLIRDTWFLEISIWQGSIF